MAPGKQSRGRMVGLVFAMQGAGLIVGPLVASALLGSGLSNDTTWRILLALGAIPGLAVFYLRRQIHETPRFALAGGAAEEAEAAVAAATGAKPSAGTAQESRARHAQGALEGFATLARNRRMLKLLNPHASLLHNTLVQLAIFAVFAVPGYFVAIAPLDRTGRRPIQILGFALMGLMFLLIGFIPSVVKNAAPFVVLYGISYFFTEFGPNTTTFIYPAELFPVEVRTTGHGISAGLGKMGAFAGAYLFPDMLASSLGIRGAEVVAGVVSLVGVDGSPHSDAALRWALEEAEVRGGEVTAVFAWQVPFLSFPGAGLRSPAWSSARSACAAPRPRPARCC
jgi:MFS transporter, PHS family, inorganic phosphate transporter